MKVSSAAALVGVQGWGPPRCPAGRCGPREGRPSWRRAGLAPREGARWRGRCAASGPARLAHLGAGRGPRPSCSQARPAAWAPGKFPHYRCQLARH